MIDEFRGELQAELKVVCEEVNELRANTTKVLDHISDGLERNKNTMPSTVVLDDVAQIQKDVNVLMKGATSYQTKWVFGSLEFLIGQQL